MPRGAARVIALPAADAGLGLSYLFPGVADFEVVAFAFRLQTAAGGGARQVVVSLFDSSGARVYGVAAPDPQPGGATVNYSLAPGIVAGGSSALGFQQAPLAGGRLPNNLELFAGVAGAAAGDVLANARLLVLERLHDRAD